MVVRTKSVLIIIFYFINLFSKTRVIFWNESVEAQILVWDEKDVELNL
jgi:regulatory protein YycI of two-component signal transduction system YycFG